MLPLPHRLAAYCGSRAHVPLNRAHVPFNRTHVPLQGDAPQKVLARRLREKIVVERIEAKERLKILDHTIATITHDQT